MVWQFLLKRPNRLLRPVKRLGRASRPVATTFLHRLPKGPEPNRLLLLGKGRQPKRIHPAKLRMANSQPRKRKNRKRAAPRRKTRLGNLWVFHLFNHSDFYLLLSFVFMSIKEGKFLLKMVALFGEKGVIVRTKITLPSNTETLA